MLHSEEMQPKGPGYQTEKDSGGTGGLFLTDEADCCSLRLSQECSILCPLLYHVCKNKQHSQGNLPLPFSHVELISKPHYL